MSVGDTVTRRGAYRPRGEIRDPTAATTALRWHGKGQAQVPDWNAEQAIRFGYHANVIAYRCAAVIADTLAGVPFRAGAAPPERPGATAEHNPKARLARLLGPPPGGPAPKLSARRLWAWTIAQRLVTGRNGWEIETTGPNGTGQIVALWPLTSAHLKAIPSRGGAEWFSGFEYGRPDDLKALQPAQVHYGWSSSLTDFRQPFSPLQVARYALSIALGIDKYQYAFIENGAVPAVIVGVEAFETPEKFEGFKRQWNSRYQGPDNAGQTHFVELDPGDADSKLSEALFVQTVGATAKDARIPESYKAALEQVAISLGVPWSKLDASGRTFDNASEEDRSFWQGTVVGLATDLADEVNMGLAPRLGSEVGWFDLSGVRALQPRPVAEPKDIPGLISAGVISPDEARPWLFLAGPAPEPPAVEEVEEEIEEAEIVEPPALPPAPQDREGAGREGRATVDQERRRSAIWRSTDTVIQAEERRWERRWRRLFETQEKEVLAKLNGARGKPLAAACRDRVWANEQRGPADGLFDPAFWVGRTEEEAADLFSSLADGAFAMVSAHFGVSFDIEAEFAQLFITTRSNQLAGQVTDTTYRALTDALAAGVAEGESIPKLAARIREVFADAKGNRSTVIARTEVISGHNAAALSAATSLPAGVVAAAQWIATRDSRTRPTHATADGQIVAVGQPFTVAGIAAAYPGDPSLPAAETVQCRCAVAFLTPEEFEAEAALYAEGLAAAPVPVGRARTALAMVSAGEFDETRFRKALEVAA